MKKLLIVLLFIFLAGCAEAGENNRGGADSNILQERESVQVAEEIVTASKEIKAVCEKICEAVTIGALNIAEDMHEGSLTSEEAAEEVEDSGEGETESEVIQGRLPAGF